MFVFLLATARCRGMEVDDLRDHLTIGHPIVKSPLLVGSLKLRRNNLSRNRSRPRGSCLTPDQGEKRERSICGYGTASSKAKLYAPKERSHPRRCLAGETLLQSDVEASSGGIHIVAAKEGLRQAPVSVPELRLRLSPERPSSGRCLRVFNCLLEQRMCRACAYRRWSYASKDALRTSYVLALAERERDRQPGQHERACEPDVDRLPGEIVFPKDLHGSNGGLERRLPLDVRCETGLHCLPCNRRADGVQLRLQEPPRARASREAPGVAVACSNMSRSARFGGGERLLCVGNC